MLSQMRELCLFTCNLSHCLHLQDIFFICSLDQTTCELWQPNYVFRSESLFVFMSLTAIPLDDHPVLKGRKSKVNTVFGYN